MSDNRLAAADTAKNADRVIASKTFGCNLVTVFATTLADDREADAYLDAFYNIDAL